MKIFNDPMIGHRMNEDLWFSVHQPMLLRMANTKVGRDLLCIPQEYGKIVEFSKRHVKMHLYGDTFMADFRVGAKWANIIRMRWPQFLALSRYFMHEMPVGSPLTRYARSVLVTTTTFYPDPNPETTTVDGFIQNTGTVYLDVRNAADGSAASDTATTNEIENANEPNIYVKRSMTLFDTSPIGASSVDSGTFSVTKAFSFDGENDLLRLVTCSPASNTAITTADFDQFTTTQQATADFDISSFAAGYNDWTLGAAGLASVSTSGVTKFGLRCVQDCNATDPGGVDSNLVGFASADTANTTSDPKLVIVYTALPTGYKNLPLLFVG